MRKIIYYLKKPKLLLCAILKTRIFNFIPDKLFLEVYYKLITGKKLDLENPVSYNEKLQWLKIYDRKNIYTIMVDKYEAKQYVANIIGKEYIIPTIGVYNKFEEIDFNKLPNRFVIKCTHDSGGLVIVKDKKTIDINLIRRKINKCLRKNYYNSSKEWPYKNVKPRIIIEKYMEDNNNISMRDYKFFCFNGVPKLMYLSEGLEDHSTARMSFYDMNFDISDCKRADYKQLEYVPKKPKTFEKMKEFASLLSHNIPHLRVDFYEINGKLYFGELTFFTCSGFIPFEKEKWNKKLGEWIKIPLNK